MKQERFKSMYQQIHLEETQKDRIWRSLEEDRERNAQKIFRLPARAAVCACVLLVSGMTVFAASGLSLMDRLTEAMNLLTHNKQELTEEQKNIYAQYGIPLDNEIARANGTFKLEAALYDENYLFIPFRYILNPDSKGYEEIVAGFTFEESNMWQSDLLEGYRQDLRDLWYGVSQGSRQARGIAGSIYVLNPEVEEDGVLTGSLLLSVEVDKAFGQGDVIQFVRKAEQPEIQGKLRWLEDGEDTEGLEVFGSEETGYLVLEEDYTIPDEILTEFTLGNAVEQHSVSIDAAQSETLEQIGLSVEQMTVSALSLHFSGILLNETDVPYTWAVVLKNGDTVIESASGGISSDIELSKAGDSVFAFRLFAAPVQIEEIAGIRIQHGTSEMWIPVN